MSNPQRTAIDEPERIVLNNIAEYGWHCVNIVEDDGQPPWNILRRPGCSDVPILARHRRSSTLLQPKIFWDWVTAHRSELLEGAPRRQSAIDHLADLLHQYDPTLGFEIQGAVEQTLEITITALGNAESFPSVRTLVEAATESNDLTPIAFRQPEGPEFELEAHGRVFSPDNVWFEPMRGKDDPASLGLQFFFQDGDDLPISVREELARLMLQAILGEYEAATRINHIQIMNVSGIEIEKYLPLADIAKYLIWHARKYPSTRH